MSSRPSSPRSRLLVLDLDKGSHPRGPQLVFATPVLCVALLIGALEGGLTPYSWLTLGLVLLVVVTAVVVALPERLSSRPVVAVIAVLDMAVVGLLHVNHLQAGIAAFLVLPALWLGRELGRTGVVVAVVGVVLTFSVPLWFYLPLAPETLARSVLLPMLALVTSMAVHGLDAQYEAKQAELLDQRRISDTILDTVDVGLVLLNDDGTYHSVNARHHDFMALAFGDTHQGRAGQIGHVYGADGVTPLSEQGMPSLRAARGEEFSDALIWVGEDLIGRVALSVSARTIRNTDGSFGGAVLAYKDVTEMMHALKVKDDFVASVSHELRTPLTSIMGYLDLTMDEDGLSPSVVHHLGVANRNATRLLRLVNDLLQVASAAQGRLVMEPQPVDVAALVTEVIEELRPFADQSGVTLRAELGTVPVLMVDASRVAQVVHNLISNAVKYTLQGGEVTVALAKTQDGVNLSVADSGIGISEEDQERLFTRFFRSADVEQRAIPGVGLGLAIVRAIIEAHGGRIRIRSELGHGTTVSVWFPPTVLAPAGVTLGRAVGRSSRPA